MVSWLLMKPLAAPASQSVRLCHSVSPGKYMRGDPSEWNRRLVDYECPVIEFQRGPLSALNRGSGVRVNEKLLCRESLSETWRGNRLGRCADAGERSGALTRSSQSLTLLRSWRCCALLRAGPWHGRRVSVRRIFRVWCLARRQKALLLALSSDRQWLPTILSCSSGRAGRR